jgi:hypothetical protein
VKTKESVPFVRFELPLSEEPDHHPPKIRTFLPGDAIEDTAFKPGFEIVKF